MWIISNDLSSILINLHAKTCPLHFLPVCGCSAKAYYGKTNYSMKFYSTLFSSPNDKLPVTWLPHTAEDLGAFTFSSQSQPSHIHKHIFNPLFISWRGQCPFLHNFCPPLCNMSVTQYIHQSLPGSFGAFCLFTQGPYLEWLLHPMQYSKHYCRPVRAQCWKFHCHVS